MGFFIFGNEGCFCALIHFIYILPYIFKGLNKAYAKKKVIYQHYKKKIPKLEEKIKSENPNKKIIYRLERVTILILFLKINEEKE